LQVKATPTKSTHKAEALSDKPSSFARLKRTSTSTPNSGFAIKARRTATSHSDTKERHPLLHRMNAM
jgi:hypothetical protein